MTADFVRAFSARMQPHNVATSKAIAASPGVVILAIGISRLKGMLLTKLSGL